MSYEFKVGDKVVCVDDIPHHSDTDPKLFRERYGLKIGNIYTVRWVGIFQFDNGTTLAIKLNGIKRREYSHSPPNDNPFGARRFRPLVSQSTELFRRIAQGVTDGKHVVEDQEYRQPTPEKVSA